MRTPALSAVCAIICTFAFPVFAALIPIPQSGPSARSQCTHYSGYLMYKRSSIFSDLPYYLDRGSPQNSIFTVTTVSSQAGLFTGVHCNGDDGNGTFGLQLTNSNLSLPASQTWVGIYPKDEGIYAGLVHFLQLMTKEPSVVGPNGTADGKQTSIWKMDANNQLTAWWDNGNNTSSQMYLYPNAAPAIMSMTNIYPTEGPLELVQPTIVADFSSCSGPVVCGTGSTCTLLKSQDISTFRNWLVNSTTAQNSAAATKFEAYLDSINPSETTTASHPYPNPAVCLDPMSAVIVQQVATDIETGNWPPARGVPAWPV